MLISMLLWPVVLIFRRRNSAVEDAPLNELKQHLVAHGRKITESAGVLMTYRRVVEKQFLKVAKERREHLPEVSLRESSLHYVDAFEANEPYWKILRLVFASDGINFDEALCEEVIKEKLQTTDFVHTRSVSVAR